MRTIQTVAGIVAVLFSIQPLASWAAEKGKEKEANSGHKSGKEKQVSIEKSNGKEKTVAGESPICGIGLK